MGIYLNKYHSNGTFDDSTPTRKHEWLLDLGARPINAIPDRVSEVPSRDVLVIRVANRFFDSAFVAATQHDLERVLRDTTNREKFPYFLARHVAMSYVERRHQADLALR